MKNTIAIILFTFLLSSCGNSNNGIKFNSKVEINTLDEKEMPFLEIKESRLKSTDPNTNKHNAQIAYSAYKRALKFISQDTVTLMLHYEIEDGAQINISPLLQDFIEGFIYFTNKEIDKMLKDKVLKEKFNLDSVMLFNIEEHRKNISNENIPSWAKTYKMIQDYRNLKNSK